MNDQESFEYLNQLHHPVAQPLGIAALDAHLVAQGFVASGAPLRDADLRAAVAAATVPDALDDALAEQGM